MDKKQSYGAACTWHGTVLHSTHSVLCILLLLLETEDTKNGAPRVTYTSLLTL